MKIVWLSANRLGYELVKEAIMRGINIDSIITLSDNATTIMYDNIKKEKWEGLGIKIYRVERLNEEKELIKQLSPDIIVMCGWRQIIDKEILDIPKDFVGFHPTLLPKGRGPAPIINSILSGFKETGVTMFYVVEGVDTGVIIGQEKFTIEDSDYAKDVYNKVIIAGRELIKKYLPLLIEGKAPRIPQDDSKATVFEGRSFKDNEINLEKESIEDIHKKIRALSKPYKGAYIKKDNKKLMIWRADVE